MPESTEHVCDSAASKVETQKEQHDAIDRHRDPTQPTNGKESSEDKATAAARTLKKQLSTESDKDVLEAANAYDKGNGLQGHQNTADTAIPRTDNIFFCDLQNSKGCIL